MILISFLFLISPSWGNFGLQYPNSKRWKKAYNYSYDINTLQPHSKIIKFQEFIDINCDEADDKCQEDYQHFFSFLFYSYYLNDQGLDYQDELEEFFSSYKKLNKKKNKFTLDEKVGNHFCLEYSKRSIISNPFCLSLIYIFKK